MSTLTLDLPGAEEAQKSSTEGAAASKRGRTRFGRGVRQLVDLLGGALLVALVGIAAAAIAVPALLGATPLTVLTSSMEPHYPAGTLIVVQPRPAEEIMVGDVITYQLHSGRPDVVTHRVIEVAIDANGEHVFRTQGDNNPQPDPGRVREVQLKGELLYAVPGLGWVQNALAGSTREVLVPVVAGALFLYAAATAGGALIDRRRARRNHTAEPADPASTQTLQEAPL